VSQTLTSGAGQGVEHAHGLATAGAARRASAPWVRGYTRVALGLDALAVLTAAVVAWLARFGTAGVDGSAAVPTHYAVFATLLVPMWLAVMWIDGCYDYRLFGRGTDEYRKLITAGIHMLAVIAVFDFVVHVQTARGLIAVFVPLALALTLIERYLLRKHLQRARARGECAERVLLVGEQASIEQLGRHLTGAPWAGFAVVGACSTEPDEPHALTDRELLHVAGRVADVLDTVEPLEVDAVVVANATVFSSGELRQLSWDLKDRGIQLIVAPIVTDIAGPRISTRPVAGLPLLHVEEPRFSPGARFYKAVFDPLLAIIGIVLLSPLLLVTAIAVRVTSRGPVLYRQERIGLHGQPFTVWKFRTMSRDAHARKATLIDLNDADGVLFKMRDDPRITRVGRFLRRFSIDELPQLAQVLSGKMSLVGPRPPLPEEVECYEAPIERRLLVKPGLTGLWQVSGRADLPWDESVRLDLHYVDHWSPAMDMAILLKTVGAVIRGQGAY